MQHQGNLIGRATCLQPSLQPRLAAVGEKQRYFPRAKQSGSPLLDQLLAILGRLGTLGLGNPE